MNFVDKINYFENLKCSNNYIITNGNNPILITAPHSIAQVTQNGNIKLNEPYTKAIALYLSQKMDVYSIIKNKDTGIDSNSDTSEKMKDYIIETINKNNISLLLDIHGASKNRKFDIELGTLNNLSTDYYTLNELKNAFISNNITNVYVNDPFKGGAITRTVYGMTKANAIQIEINGKYRNKDSLEELEKICISLENFIKKYIRRINL